VRKKPRAIPATAAAQADSILAEAPRSISRLALACLRGRPDAAKQVRDTLETIERARAALRAVDDDAD
jgi:hypothetical protein